MQQPCLPQLLRPAQPVSNRCMKLGSTLSSQKTFDLEFNLTIYIFQPSCITNLLRTFSFQRAFQQRHHQRQPVSHHPTLESSRADTNWKHPHGQPERIHWSQPTAPVSPFCPHPAATDSLLNPQVKLHNWYLCCKTLSVQFAMFSLGCMSSSSGHRPCLICLQGSTRRTGRK